MTLVWLVRRPVMSALRTTILLAEAYREREQNARVSWSLWPKSDVSLQIYIALLRRRRDLYYLQIHELLA